jgi:hypothetical protein
MKDVRGERVDFEGMSGILGEDVRIINDWLTTKMGGPGSSVGIATDYGLDGPGIESR